MAATSPGRGILFTGLASTTTQATQPFSCSQLQQASFHIRTDGTSPVNFTVQATNIPDQTAEQGPPYRNDAVTSPDWATLQTGTVAANVAGGATLATTNYTPYRFLRVLFTATSGGPITNVFAFGTGAAS